MTIDISERVAVVTGAADGIGKTIAIQLAKENVSLALWDVDLKKLASTLTEIKKINKNVIAVRCDVSNEEDVKLATLQTFDFYKKIDILVANAGILKTSKVLEMKTEDWDNTFSVNTKGVFLCIKYLAPYMKKNNKGRIIIASSFAAIIPSVSSAAYAASKSALVSLTKVLASELGPWNITVNAYAPGMIPTSMSNINNLSKDRQEEMLDTLSIREWGQAEDIANLIIFLSSDQAKYITGALIDTSGGKFSVQFQKFSRQ